MKLDNHTRPTALRRRFINVALGPVLHLRRPRVYQVPRWSLELSSNRERSKRRTEKRSAFRLCASLDILRSCRTIAATVKAGACKGASAAALANTLRAMARSPARRLNGRGGMRSAFPPLRLLKRSRLVLCAGDD